MTVLLRDGIDMAASDEQVLDDLFDRVNVPEGYRVEVVEGAVHMSPQRPAHWEIIFEIAHTLRDHFGRESKIFSDVRIDFPGGLNGFCPDLAKFRAGAQATPEGRWRYQDVEFVAEVISRDTARNDYEPKKAVYAAAAVPVYLIADPYQRRCHVFTEPKEGEYRSEHIVAFGSDVDLTATSLALTLSTKDFPVE